MTQRKKGKTNKYVYLDILRAIAVLLVIYAHFISVGMHAPEIPFIISNAKLPLLERNFLADFDFIFKKLYKFINDNSIISFYRNNCFGDIHSCLYRKTRYKFGEIFC